MGIPPLPDPEWLQAGALAGALDSPGGGTLDFFDFFHFVDFFDFFSIRQKNEKKIKKMKKIRDPGRLEPWLEPLTLPAGAPWIFLIFFNFFIFLIVLIFFEKPKNQKKSILFFFDLFYFFRKGKKTKKSKKIKKMEKIRDPGSPRVEGFWPWESLLSRILSGSRLEPWLEPLTLPAGAPWIFFDFFVFFSFF